MTTTKVHEGRFKYMAQKSQEREVKIDFLINVFIHYIKNNVSLEANWKYME